MISQEIYDYLSSLETNSSSEYANILGLIVDKGILV
jgi:hypothetical protein